MKNLGPTRGRRTAVELPLEGDEEDAERQDKSIAKEEGDAGRTSDYPTPMVAQPRARHRSFVTAQRDIGEGREDRTTPS